MTLPIDIVLSSLGQRLRERTQPLAPDDDLYEFAHAQLCEGMMLPFEQLAELVDPLDPYVPWEVLFDVNLCPEWALPWLGQIVGVRVPSGLAEQQKRDSIKALGGFQRGSPQSIINAVKITLVGNKAVIFRERDGGDAYALEIVTDTNETPNPAQTQNAILAALPAGIILRARTVVGWDYQATTAAGGTYKQLTTEFSTYTHLSLNQPG